MVKNFKPLTKQEANAVDGGVGYSPTADVSAYRSDDREGPEAEISSTHATRLLACASQQLICVLYQLVR